MYKHLGLSRWPFNVVPQPQLCTFIAGREQVRQDVERLIETLSRRESSSIHLVWSWYGAGKTHTLYYLANRLRAKSRGLFVTAHHPVYCEFPKAARGFLDLYRSILTRFDVNALTDAVLETFTSGNADTFERELFMASPDLGKALKVLVTGKEHDQNVALRWLRADPLPIAEYRSIGIAQKISSTEEAVRIFSALVLVLNEAARSQNRRGSRVVWLLDEFQRIERLSRAAREEINTGLHSTFNACPTGVSLFLSFSRHPSESGLPSWFSQELLDRIGRTKVVILPPLQPPEALQFVKDVLEHSRDPGDNSPSPYFPFTEESCKAIIAEVQEKEELKPRSLMHAFNGVLEEADPLIETGDLKVITPAFSQRVLAEYLVLSADDPET